MDLFERIRKNPGPLGQYADSAKGYYIFPQLEGELKPRMMFNGKEVICWSVNNYLGIGHHPEVIKADADATAKYGLAYPMGSRMMSGTMNFKIQTHTKTHIKQFLDLTLHPNPQPSPSHN